MKASIVIGTRRELIKLAPVVHTLRSAGVETSVLLSGQHPQNFLRPLMDFFHIEADVEIPAIESHASLDKLSYKLLEGMEARKHSLAADYLIVHGGTATAFAGAQLAFHNQIPLVHIEAGLRTYDLESPYPEEGYRQMISRLAKHHFAPTFQAARNLMQEGIERDSLSVVGSTGIDALLFAMKNLELIEAALLNRVPAYLRDFIESENMVLVTIHRRENQGPRFQQICRNLLRLSQEVPGLRLLFPLHPNPSIREKAQEMLGDAPNILLSDSMPYLPFIYMMSKSKVVITDSGGVMEEAPTLRVPALVIRESTERGEALDSGFAKLIGYDGDALIRETLSALRSGCTGLGENPFGDGTASKRIVKKLTGAESLEQNIIVSMIETELGDANDALEPDAIDLHADELDAEDECEHGNALHRPVEKNNVIPLPTITK